MEAHDGELGPIDVAVIAYPPGAPMTGEAAPLLVDLADRGIIRVLDAMFVKKEEDGTFWGFDARNLDDRDVGDFTVFEGASSGLLGDEDAAKAAEALEPGTAAVLIAYENRWAAPFIAAVRRNGGRAGRVRAHPGTGCARCPRCPRPPPQRRPDRKERSDARTASRRSPHGGSGRNGNRCLESREPPPG